jgi:hypothetical protein
MVTRELMKFPMRKETTHNEIYNSTSAIERIPLNPPILPDKALRVFTKDIVRLVARQDKIAM